jgi:hypothetical protein
MLQHPQFFQVFHGKLEFFGLGLFDVQEFFHILFPQGFPLGLFFGWFLGTEILFIARRCKFLQRRFPGFEGEFFHGRTGNVQPLFLQEFLNSIRRQI